MSNRMSELSPERIEKRLSGTSRVLPTLYEEWWRLRLAFTDMTVIVADPWCIEQMRENAKIGASGWRRFQDYGDTCVFAGIPIEVGASEGRTLRWTAESLGVVVDGELCWSVG